MDTPPKRFWIDGSMARRGGGFTYLVNVIPELARLAPEARFLVAAGDEQVADSIPRADNVEVRFLGQLGLRDRLRFTYREAAAQAAEWGADVYFSAGELAPIDARCPTIAAFRNPNVFTLGKGQGLSWKQRARLVALNGLARLSARNCDRVLFVSEDSARWIGDSIGLPENRRRVVYHGIDPAPWREATKPARERSFILSVSSIYPYKNYVRLIRAYAEMARRLPDVPELVIVGDNQDSAYAREMQQARHETGDLAEMIHILGEVPYQEVKSFYKEASLFVFPSHLETFGHPLLEAMASECPLVAADIPVFREIAGDAAVYGDPFDERSMANAMESALTSVSAHTLLVKRGRDRVAQFSWERSARNLLTLFSEVAAESRSPAHSRGGIGFPATLNPGPAVGSRLGFRAGRLR
ncbi:MAG: glycosyltransferase family 1 protein [Myxococcota bacterium]|nr:glycosyltransferase family 1 protein [Myxococcota bacterium]